MIFCYQHEYSFQIGFSSFESCFFEFQIQEWMNPELKTWHVISYFEILSIIKKKEKFIRNKKMDFYKKKESEFSLFF